MRRTLFACLLLLIGSSDLLAQSHPCDATQPTTFAVQRNQSVRVGFCHDQRDEDNIAIPLGQIRFRLVNASTQALIADLGLLSPLTGPNAAGLYYFESPQRFFTADVNLAVSAEYSTLAATSLPIFIDVRGGPKPPSGARVVL